jgi:putative ABC transport system substrate-binding protein
MKRAEFMAGTAALLVSPLCLRAQGTRRRIGLLAIDDGTGHALNQTELALLEGLRNHG